MALEPCLEYINTAFGYKGDENMDKHQKCSLFTINTAGNALKTNKQKAGWLDSDYTIVYSQRLRNKKKGK